MIRLYREDRVSGIQPGVLDENPVARFIFSLSYGKNKGRRDLRRRSGRKIHEIGNKSKFTRRVGFRRAVSSL